MKKCYLTVFLLLSFGIYGCAGTLPVTYVPQNFARYQGRVDIGRFKYLPAEQGIVAPNQIQNTAIGRIYIGANVSDFVQRANALELEKTGFNISDSNPLQIAGEVIEFKADDLGYSVDWSYSIRYIITRKKDSAELLNKVYTAEPKKTGKFSRAAADYGPSVNEMVLSGYDKFIRDEEVRNILSTEKK
jgi:hypothetical protein